MHLDEHEGVHYAHGHRCELHLDGIATCRCCLLYATSGTAMEMDARQQRQGLSACGIDE